MAKTRRSTKRGKPKWPRNLLARVRRLRDRLRDEKLDAYLLTCPTDIRYLTGFPGEDSWTLITPRSVVILSDSRFAEELGGKFAYATSAIRKKGLTDELEKLAKRYRLRAIGIQAEHMSVAQRRAVMKKVGAKALTETTGWLLEQRAIKDEDEVKLIRKAVDIQQRAFKQLLTELKPGMTERRICARLEFLFRELGGDGASFKTIIAAGANSSIPHYFPTDVKLKKNSPLLIDFGVIYRGYHSDMTRVVCLGKFPKQIAEIYAVVEAAQKLGIEAIKPGAALKYIDHASRSFIEDAGYGKRFRHGLGHGIGLQIHEEPRLGETAEGELKEGHVVTVEPGVYLPGVGGVRLEDDVLVTADGHRNLCNLPTDIESAMI